jgi:HAD superfamily hydrolase (TIGR01662 family)
MSVAAVVFDVGEVLIDESRHRARWIEWAGIDPILFDAEMRAAIERGEEYGQVFRRLSPGFDIEAGRAALKARHGHAPFDAEDLYPDVRDALAGLRAAGFRLGVAGNQPVESEHALRALDLPLDFIASSAGWGVRKPAPAFFARVAESAGVEAARIAYVGDRLDNDVLPARAAGMVAVFLKRGPWAAIHALTPQAAQAHLQVDGLAELPARLKQLGK